MLFGAASLRPLVFLLIFVFLFFASMSFFEVTLRLGRGVDIPEDEKGEGWGGLWRDLGFGRRRRGREGAEHTRADVAVDRVNEIAS